MGAMVVFGTCYGCGRTFMFNATKVPSVSADGKRQPICGDCVARINPIREAKGLDPIRVLPGAYDAEEVD